MSKTVTHEFDNMNDIFDSLEDTITALRGFAGLLDMALHDGDIQPYADGVTMLLNKNIAGLETLHKAAFEEERTRLREWKEDAGFRDLLYALSISDDRPETFRRHFLQYFGNETQIQRIASVLEVDADVVGGLVAFLTAPQLVDKAEMVMLAERSKQNNAKHQIADERRGALLRYLGTDDLHRVATKLGLDENTVYNVVVSLAIPETAEQDAYDNPATAKPADLRKEFIADKIKEGVDAGQIAQALNLKKQTVERVIGQLLAGQSNENTEDGQQVANG